MSLRLRLIVGLLGLAFFVSHVRTLPRTLEDMDSINFALGVEKFDVSTHRPHPPGYPVYIALGKVSTWMLGAALPNWDRDRRAAGGLALFGLVAGTLAAGVLTRFWIAAGLAPHLAFFAAVLAIASPLFWFSAARPLSDTPGLLGSIWIQGLLIGGLRAIRATPSARLPRACIWAALGAGLLVGFRSQVLWLTGALLLWCTAELLIRRRWREAAVVAGAAGIGVVVWVVPLLWNTGGFANYFALVDSQAAADLRGAELLATSPTWRLLKTVCFRTFVWPWTAPPLAYVVIAAALAGLGRLSMGKGQRAKGNGFVLAAVLLSYLPYLAFHFTYQETVTLRYALPLVVPVAGLAVLGLAELRSRFVIAGAVAGVAAASLAIVTPRLAAYSREGSAIFRAFQDIVRFEPSMTERPVLRMHHQVWWGVQREIDWFRPVWDMGQQPFPGSREWLTIVGDWRAGSGRPAWFLTDVTRTDVVLFDWRSRTLRGRYRYPQRFAT